MSNLRRRLYLDTSDFERGAARVRSLWSSMLGGMRSGISSAARAMGASGRAIGEGTESGAKAAEAAIRRVRAASKEAKAELDRIDARKGAGFIDAREAERQSERVRRALRQVAVEAKKAGKDGGDALAKEIAEGLDKAGTSLERSGATLFGGLRRRIGGAFSGIGGMISGLIGGAAIGGAITQMVRLNATMEQTEIAFGAMLGSGEKAKEMLRTLTDLAARTPLQLQEVADAARKLLAFGFDDKGIEATITRLGDVAAGTGARLNDVVMIYGQVKQKGQLYAEEVLQFAERGIPIVAELAKVLGVSEKQVRVLTEKGQVGFREVALAFDQMSKEGGRFGNMMEKQSKSFIGMLSTAKDYAEQALRSAGGKLFERLRSDLGGVMDSIKDDGEGSRMAQITTAIADALETVYLRGKAVVLFLVEYRSAIAAAIGVIVTYRVATTAAMAVELALNTVRSAGRAIVAAYTIATNVLAYAKARLTANTVAATAATNALKVAMSTSVIGALVQILVAAAGAFLLLRGRTDEASTAMGRLRKDTADAIAEIKKLDGMALFSRQGEVRQALDDARRAQAKAIVDYQAALGARYSPIMDGRDVLMSAEQVRANELARIRERMLATQAGVLSVMAQQAEIEERTTTDAGVRLDYMRAQREEIVRMGGDAARLAQLNRDIAAEEARQAAARTLGLGDPTTPETKTDTKAENAAKRAAEQAADRLKAARELLRDMRQAAEAVAAPELTRALPEALTDIEDRARKATGALAEMTAQSRQTSSDERAAMAASVAGLEAQRRAVEVGMRRIGQLPAAMREASDAAVRDQMEAVTSATLRIAELEGALARIARLPSSARPGEQSTDRIRAEIERERVRQQAAVGVGSFLATIDEQAREAASDAVTPLLARLQRDAEALAQARIGLAAAVRDGDKAGALDLAQATEAAKLRLMATERLIQLYTALPRRQSTEAGQAYQAALDQVQAIDRRMRDLAGARDAAGKGSPTRRALESELAELREERRALDALLVELGRRASPLDVATSDVLAQIARFQERMQQSGAAVELQFKLGTISEKERDAALVQIGRSVKKEIEAILADAGDSIPPAVAEALGKLADLIPKATDDSVKQALKRIEGLKQRIETLAGTATGILNLGKAFGVVSAEIESVMRGAIDALEAVSRLQDVRKAEKSGDLKGTAASLARAGGYIGIALAGASMIKGLVDAIGTRRQREREEMERLTEALKQNASQVSAAIERLVESDRMGGSARRDQADRVALAWNGYQLGRSSGDFGIGTSTGGWPIGTGTGGATDPNRGRLQFEGFLREIQRIGLRELDGIDLVKLFADAVKANGGSVERAIEAMLGGTLPGMRVGLEELVRQMQGLGQFADTVRGAAAATEYFSRVLGETAQQGLERFADALLKMNGGKGLDEDLKKLIEEARGLDVGTQGGRDRLTEIARAVARALAREGDLSLLDQSTMTTEEVQTLIDTLLGLAERGASAAGGEVTRGVQVARSITEFQASEVVTLLEEILHQVRRIASAFPAVPASGGTPALLTLPAPTAGARAARTIGRTALGEAPGAGDGGGRPLVVDMSGWSVRYVDERSAAEIAERLERELVSRSRRPQR